MEVFDLYAKGGPVERVSGKPGFRFQLARTVLVKEKETLEEIRITEFEADDTGDELIHLYVGRETEALDPEKFEIVRG